MTDEQPIEEPVDEEIAAAPDHSPEFPSDWHREAFINGLEREIEGARVREDAEMEANAERELARVLGGEKPKQTRPRGTRKQTR